MATDVSLSRIFTDQNHSISVLEQLNEHRMSYRFCDVILRVGKDEVYAHSNVLAAASPYFGTFLGHGQDHPRAFSQKTPQIIEIHIDGSGDNVGYADAVSLIVDYMYSSKLQLESKFLVQVIEIAKIMQMNNILEYCRKFEIGEMEDNQKNLPNGVYTQTNVDFTNETAVQTEDMNIPEEPDKTDVGRPIKRQKLFTRANMLSNSNAINVNVETKYIKTNDTEVKEIEILEDNVEINMCVAGKRKRGRPAKIKISPIKKCKDKDMLDSSIQTEPTADTSEDEETTDINESFKHKHTDNTIHGNSEENDVNTKEGKLPSRKTRGKRPAKFIDEAESDSDALIVDETEEISQYPRTKLLPCGECPYSTYSLYHFRRHQQAHKNDREGNKKMYKCDRCDFSAPKLKDLQTHAREHLHAKNICSFCDFEAESAESLIEHLPIHQPPYPFHCLYCDLKYKTRAQLNVHLPKHMNAKPFVCEICQTGFKWKHALKCHMATHSNTKEHLCDVCGFSTAHKSQLKAHKLIHTGDTFKCEYPNCKFQSIKKQSLKYHMLTHTQEKPHQCEICGQSFSLVKNMKRHALLHTDDRPHKCKFSDVCNFATTRYDKLKEHLLKIHNKGETPSKKFRLSDYPKSLIPPDDHEILEANEKIQNIIHIENSNIDINQGNEIETKVYIQQPGGEPIPVTLVASKFEIPYQFITRLEN